MFFLDFLKVFEVFLYFLTDFFDSSNPFGTLRLRVQNFARKEVSSDPRLRNPRLLHSDGSKFRKSYKIWDFWAEHPWKSQFGGFEHISEK